MYFWKTSWDGLGTGSPAMITTLGYCYSCTRTAYQTSLIPFSQLHWHLCQSKWRSERQKESLCCTGGADLALCPHCPLYLESPTREGGTRGSSLLPQGSISPGDPCICIQRLWLQLYLNVFAQAILVTKWACLLSQDQQLLDNRPKPLA